MYVGDVRNLDLLEGYAASVEWYHSDGAVTREAFRDSVGRRVREEEELLVSPAYFYGLQKKYPRISGVSVYPKRGRAPNECTRFRYEVVLRGGGQTCTMRHDACGRDSVMPGVRLAAREVMHRTGLVRGLEALIGLDQGSEIPRFRI